MFFSFDGMDGVGKSTQAALFTQWLREEGHEIVSCRDPGSSQLGERVRQILLDDASLPIHRRSEMLLYMAARAQLVEEIIRPALAANKTVVSDRFLLANLVYQAHAGGLSLEDVRRVGEIAVAGVQPDRVFLLNLSPQAAKARLGGQMDRMEQQGDAYWQQVHRGFLAEAALQPDRIRVIDASGSVEDIQASIRRHAADLLNANSG